MSAAEKAEVAGSNPARSTSYELVAHIDETLVIAKVSLDQLREQDLNARFMPAPMFQQLVTNIEKRGTLESLPFCVLRKDGIEVMSGHHRIRALRAAKYTRPVWILLETAPLSRDEIAAKQLAHNSIQGYDDMSVLREIYLGIQDANARIEAFIDEKKLEIPQPANISVTPLNTGLEFQAVKLLFLPHQLADFDSVLRQLDGTEEQIFVTPLENWELFKQAVLTLTKKERILSIGAAVARMAEIVLEKLADPTARPYDADVCKTCDLTMKQHCLTPGDPGPNCPGGTTLVNDRNVQ